MGTVHIAEHRDTGERVALKTVSGGSATALTALRREIYVLDALDHPGIVRIVGHDLHEGVPWYAMEWVRGRSLREICPRRPIDVSKDTISDSTWWTAGLGETEAPTEHAPLSVGRRFWTLEQDKRVLPVARAICQALSYLHGRGLLHGDLKPDNILLRPDQSPVLVDFGLQSRFHRDLSREALEMPRRAGTGYYLAPELIRHQLPDARADLYALGCVLYELITGQPPFLGKIEQVTWQQLYSEPTPLSDRVDDVPPVLASVVMRLLEKRPQDRFGYASDVFRALSEGEDEASGSPYLYRSAFIARERELDAVADRVASGKGGVLLIVGQSGTGKTRLALEGAGAGRKKGTSIASGVCFDHDARPLEPFRPILQRLADRCRAAGPEGVAATLGDRAAILGRFEPSLIDLPGHRVEVRSAPATQVTAALREVLDTQGTVLLLDDIQWADGLSIEFLRSEAENLQRMVVVATVRVEEAADVLAVLDGIAGVARIDVAPLDREAIGAIAGEMLALDQVPDAFADFLYQHSEGNPLYVAEYLRSAMDAGLLNRSAGVWELGGHGLGRVEDLPFPNTLRDLLARRLDGLGEGARKLAEVAAVIDGEMSQEPLILAADLEPAAAALALRELHTRQIIEKTGAGVVQLTHGKIGEVLRDRWTNDTRAALILSAAEALNEAALALFKEQDIRKSMSMTLRCEELYGQVLPEDDPRLAENATALAMLSWQLGDLEAAQGHAERSLEIVNEPVPDRPMLLPMLLNNLAVVLKNRGRYGACEGLYRRCLALNRDALGDQHLHVAHTLDNLAQLLQVLGRYSEAQEAAEESVERGIEILGADHPMVAYSLNNLACIQVKLHSPAAGLKLHERALAIREAALSPDHPTVAFSLNHLGNLHRILGNRDLGEQMMMRALAITEGVCGPDHYNTAQVLHNLAHLRFADGEIDEARAHGRRALDIREATYGRNHPEVADNLLLLADLHGGESARMYRKLALKVFLELFGEDHPDTRQTRAALDA